jgi:hypothetical protein
VAEPNASTTGLTRTELGLIAVLAVAAVIAVGFLLGRYPAFFAAAVAIAFFAGALLFARRSIAREGVQGVAALLSSLAVLLAAYWYFIDRRGYPKLNVEPEVKAWPVGNGAMLVWVALRLSNVGNLALQFDPKSQDKVIVQVGQMAPLTGHQATALLGEMQAKVASGNKEFRLIRTDSWSARATFQEAIKSTIEAGETENLYFKAVIPCVDNMVLAVTATVPKRMRLVGTRVGDRKQRDAWIAQAIYPTEAKCTGGAAIGAGGR